MQLKPDQLHELHYELTDRLEHQELIPFVKLYLGKKTISSWFYTISNVLFFAAIVYWFVHSYNVPSFKIEEGITYLSYGFALAFLLLPVHEYIHALAYRWQGAPQTSYNANLKKFYFMAIADQFVANRKEFRIVALAPFTVLTSGMIVALYISNLHWTFTILGSLLTHTALCSGDFGLLSYFDFHKDKDVITYDDKSTGVSYFYFRSNETES